MKIHVVIGSHKINYGNSKYIADEFLGFCNYLDTEITETYLTEGKWNLSQLTEANYIIFSSPVYVDSLPSRMLMFLIHLGMLNLKQYNIKGVIAFSNSGFYEASHNIINLRIIRLFCYKKGIPFIGGVGIGAGEMLESSKDTCPMESMLKYKILEAFKRVKECLDSDISLKDFILVSPMISKRSYQKISHNFWNQKAKENGILEVDMYEKYKK